MCFYPIQGYKARRPNPSGKYSIVFDVNKGFRDFPIKIPCGRCVKCRLEKSRTWAIRMVHESTLHQQNCFITLTFSPEELLVHAPYGSLDVKVFQRFMKRLRKHFHFPIRFFHCGEYGERTRRPHYHAILFGIDFPDKTLWSERDGIQLYVSKLLTKIWSHGHASIGQVTFDSCAYVARYIMKKRFGADTFDAYFSGKINTETGELYTLKPEYTTMSRRPGIAHGWFQKFKTDVYPKDEVVVKGSLMKPPKYYDSLYEIESPLDMFHVKCARIRDAHKSASNNTTDRLIIREKCLKARLKLLPRNLDKDS
jgi:hypothetical protein